MVVLAEEPEGIRNPFLRVLVYGHVWLALGAGAQVWWMQTMQFAHDGRAPTLAFLGTMAFYSFMRLARVGHPELGGSPHLLWVRRNRSVLIAVMLLCGVCAVVIAWPFAAELLRVLWPAGIVALLYVIPQGVVGGRTIGLRRLPGMKSFLISAVWAWVSVLLPAAISGSVVFNDTILQLLFLQFCLVLSLVLAFDVRDARVDPSSLHTLPQLIGERATRIIAALLVLPWIASLAILAFISLLPIDPATPKGFHLVPMLLPMMGCILSIVLVLRANAQRSDLFFGFGIDGMLLLIPFLVWVGRLF